ncbi:MAG: DUF5317 domain-containing protein [Firmicutes bacterium]|nr:DUF5317 domain-containing protein [Bacillota bacterium]
MIPVSIILAVLIGKLRGGSLARLQNLDIKALPLILTALLLRVAVGKLADYGLLLPWLQVLAYLIFFYALVLNYKIPGLKMFACGCFLNFLAIIANGGTMPVSAAAIAYSGVNYGDPTGGMHSLLTDETRLSFLADIIPLRPPYFPLAQVVSVGDILIIVGIFYFIQRQMLNKGDLLVLD